MCSNVKKSPSCRVLNKPILDYLEIEENGNDENIDSDNFSESFVLNDRDERHGDERSNFIIEDDVEVDASDYCKRIVLNHHHNLKTRSHVYKN